MQVLKTILVNHTKKEPMETEVRFYRTDLDPVAKGDVFSVWAHGKLAYAKVVDVYTSATYLKADNGFTEINDIPYAMNRLVTEFYKLNKAYTEKMNHLKAVLDERVAEARAAKEQAEILKSVAVKGKVPADVKAILDAINALKSNPASALE